MLLDVVLMHAIGELNLCVRFLGGVHIIPDLGVRPVDAAIRWSPSPGRVL